MTTNTNTRAAIAAILNSNGEWMTIYYNGENEYMTAERGETVEIIEDTRPVTVEESHALVDTLYPYNYWLTVHIGTESHLRYHVKPDYMDYWGPDEDGEYEYTPDEIARLASEWDVTIESLMDQVEEV